MNKIKRRPFLITRSFEEGYIVFDTRVNKKIYKLNETAHFIWEHCEEGSTSTELVDLFCREYEVDYLHAKNDVEFFVNELVNMKLLEIING